MRRLGLLLASLLAFGFASSAYSQVTPGRAVGHLGGLKLYASGGGPITVVAQGNSGQGVINTGLTFVLNPTAGGVSGDLIIVTLSDLGDSAQPTAVASTIPGCTTLTQLSHVTATPQSSAIYSCIASGTYTSANTITGTWAGTGRKLMVASSAHGVSTHDITNQTSGNSTSITFTYGTLATTPEVIFVAYLIQDPAISYTPDATLNQVDFAFDVGNSAGYVLILSYINPVSTSGVTVTSTLANAKPWQALWDSFK